MAQTIQQVFDLTGKTALISGASGHLGTDMAIALAEAGANVVVSSRDLKLAQQVADSLPARNDQRHFGIAMDQLDEESIRQGFAQAEEFGKRLHILVNNGHAPTRDDWKTESKAGFDRQLSNATGYFLISRLFHDHVVHHKGTGSIVLVASMYGSVGSYPSAYEDIGPASPVAYHVLKGGILQMTRHLAVYWAKDGIRVNALSPGPFPRESADPLMIERLTSKSPMGRMGRPEELKGPLLFLASDASSYMTGQNLIIDGGWTAW